MSQMEPVDEFSWLQDLSSERVLRFLQQENERFHSAMSSVEPLETEIFEEVVSYLPKKDDTIPYKFGDYWYRFSYVDDSEYPCYQRSASDGSLSWETILDFSDLAQGLASLDVQVCIDRSSRCLAFAVDTTGDRIYTIYFKDLITGSLSPYSLPCASGCMAFTNIDDLFFFVELDPETLRWRWVKRYAIGSEPNKAEIIFEEEDETFSCSIYSSKGQDCLFLCSSSGEEDEVHFLMSNHIYDPPRLIAGRSPKHQYTVHFDGNEFVIRTNRDVPNFGLMTATLHNPAPSDWKTLWQPEPEAYLEDFDVLSSHIIVNERIQCKTRLRSIRRWDGMVDHTMPLLDHPFSVILKDNHELNSRNIRYEKATFTDPPQICELDLLTGEEKILKTIRLGGNFQSTQYVCKEHFVPTPDGCQVPLTLLCRHSDQGISKPTLVYVYGAYGFSIDPFILPPRFSLLDRGFCIAIAHVRGGGELGGKWHDAGRAQNKPCSIADFIACCTYLLQDQLATRLYAMAESAGGAIVGAALNQHPEMFAGVVAIAPFVDFLNTLSDPSLPLTTIDYGEWGNPSQPDDHRCMLSYVPYQNLCPQIYPYVLAMISLQDTQVPPWEAAKWIAKMRAVTTGSAQQFLKTEFDTGHAGRSGRTEQYRDIVLAYAFLLAIEYQLIADHRQSSKGVKD